MPTALNKATEQLFAPPQTPPLGAIVAIGEQSVEWAESPARQLHDRLIKSFVAPPAREGTELPARTRLAILVGASSFLWLLIGLAAKAILQN